MLAYKFRSALQIDFALDIMFNKRLYCGDWSQMNDPTEGQFAHYYASTEKSNYKRKLDDIKQHLKNIKICSLSKTFDCHLLWAHYASGFSGLAIEVELPDNSDIIKEVTYGGVFSMVSIANKALPNEIARQIFSSKYREWAYEQEVRIMNNTEWYSLQSPVRRVIVGHRMNSSLFRGLRIICDNLGIPINRTGIGDEGIDADHVPAI